MTAATLINHNDPMIMHIDLNSCFATIEQQAFPHLRNKPLVIAAYTTPNGCIVSPSIEAKRYGIKVGMTIRDARLLCPQVIARDPDPLLVRDVHIKFKKIFGEYSPTVVPKSIDEAVIDFTGTPAYTRGIEMVAQEIKGRLRKEIGDWISCSIGVGTNRFLAKLGASLHKPDGLDVITHKNLLSIYESLTLIDLTGINVRYQARLNTHGIFTPLQFFHASEEHLQKRVFKSIIGYQWYLRLRGWETDDVIFQRKSYGHEYSLGKKTNNPAEISRILMKLCERMGRRLRGAGKAAFGVHIGCIYSDYTHWHKGKKFHTQMHTTYDLYTKAQYILNLNPTKKLLSKLSVSCYDLVESQSAQPTLFDQTPQKQQLVSDALDKINDRYGEFVITPAIMMDSKNLVLDRIAFGGVKDLEDLYNS